MQLIQEGSDEPKEVARNSFEQRATMGLRFREAATREKLGLEVGQVSVFRTRRQTHRDGFALCLIIACGTLAFSSAALEGTVLSAVSALVVAYYMFHEVGTNTMGSKSITCRM
eukprot:6173350-Amphidinium_carterae.3